MSGYLMALTAVFFWSINIIIASYFATTLEPFEIAFGLRRFIRWPTTGCWLSAWP